MRIRSVFAARVGARSEHGVVVSSPCGGVGNRLRVIAGSGSAARHQAGHDDG